MTLTREDDEQSAEATVVVFVAGLRQVVTKLLDEQLARLFPGLIHAHDDRLCVIVTPLVLRAGHCGRPNARSLGQVPDLTAYDPPQSFFCDSHGIRYSPWATLHQ